MTNCQYCARQHSRDDCPHCGAPRTSAKLPTTIDLPPSLYQWILYRKLDDRKYLARAEHTNELIWQDGSATYTLRCRPCTG